MKKILFSLLTGAVFALGAASTSVYGQSGFYYDPLHSNAIHPGGYNYFFGDDLSDTTLAGSVIVEPAEFMSHYYLDTDSDSAGDIMLAFGPWWYEPDSLSRPSDGEIVTVTGRVLDSFGGTGVIIVETLNGSLWRDLSRGIFWSGGWIDRNAVDSTRIYCPVDSASFVQFPPGGMGMGGMWGNRFFADMNQLPNDLMPDSANPNMIMGFHFEFIDESGRDMMHGDWGGFMGGHMGGHNGQWGMGWMDFEQTIYNRFHYRQELLDSLNIGEDQLVLSYWAEDEKRWVPFTDNTTLNTADNYIELVSTDLFDNIALFKDVVTAVEEEPGIVRTFELVEAYPNPFNPSVTVRFTLSRREDVSLDIFSVTGKHVKTLAEGTFDRGANAVQWRGRDARGRIVGSGVYLVRLRTGSGQIMKKVTFIK